ncbi:MAG: hypothetical protein E6K98_06095 [Thaumarchaeota archaeon]|nr:MAG: hypothetical protein E6K98_06095 [Nitrososphaerota archaeon]TLX94478.1 MAG: hypothetical protein E6K91_06225 [Nitrososphaerota archaeon]
MSSSRPPLSLRFYGISPWELEVIYALLNSLFAVNEHPDAEQEDEYYTVVDITFPLAFNDAFFRWFGSSRWDKMKGILKELKRRRGDGTTLRIYMKFTGTPNITFMIDLDQRNQFDAAIDKIDFVLELIPFHLDPKKLPRDITQVWYHFDEMSGRWTITSAASTKETYLFSQNEWKVT